MLALDNAFWDERGDRVRQSDKSCFLSASGHREEHGDAFRAAIKSRMLPLHVVIDMRGNAALTVFKMTPYPDKVVDEECRGCGGRFYPCV